MGVSRRGFAAGGPYVAWYRCVVDGLDHAVTDENFARGVHEKQGRYASVCGHVVLIGPALLAPGGRCPYCCAHLADLRSIARPTSHRRRRRAAVPVCSDSDRAVAVVAFLGGRTARADINPGGRRRPTCARRGHLDRRSPVSARLIIARPLRGTVGEARRVAHLFPVGPGPVAEHLRATCGAEFDINELETLGSIAGMPCEPCLRNVPAPEPLAIESAATVPLVTVEELVAAMEELTRALKALLSRQSGSRDE